jgi:putative restriction endonuclease
VVNPNPTRNAFREYLIAENKSGSNKAASYLRAMDLLQGLLGDHPLGFEDCRDLWQVESVERLQELLLRVSEEQRDHEHSPWFLPDQRSYLRDGFIKAALGQYRHFLAAHHNEQALLEQFRNHEGDPDELAALLNREMDLPDFLETELEGKEAVRQVKVRRNQNVFRSMILESYQHRCCVTGLDLPELCIASHIIRWADRADTRMPARVVPLAAGASLGQAPRERPGDARNGLCLSATYDKAFENHLITIDEDYRLVVSKEIREHYQNEHARELFEKRAGQVIWMPENADIRPLQGYLQDHRAKRAS